jgi:hypothetical protein
MEATKVQRLIEQWLQANHAPAARRDVLEKVMVVGKASQSYVDTITRYIADRTMQRPSKGEIKMACRAILDALA